MDNITRCKEAAIDWAPMLLLADMCCKKFDRWALSEDLIRLTRQFVRLPLKYHT